MLDAFAYAGLRRKDNIGKNVVHLVTEVSIVVGERDCIVSSRRNESRARVGCWSIALDTWARNLATAEESLHQKPRDCRVVGLSGDLPKSDISRSI